MIQTSMRVLVLAVVGTAILFPAISFAEIPENPNPYKVSVSTGYNYSSGDYGQTANTQITYIPITAKVKNGPWTAKLTVPYLKVTGPGVVVGGADPAAVGTAGAKRTESGLGDIITSLGYTFPLNNNTTFLDTTGEIKIPTADKKKKLGTGLTDYTATASLTQMLGNTYLMGKIGRKFNGSSQAFPVKDVWKYSLGAGYNFTPDFSGGANYDFRQASSSAGHPFSQAIGYLDYKLTPDVSTTVYAGFGFTKSSPDMSTGISLSYKFSGL